MEIGAWQHVCFAILLSLWILPIACYTRHAESGWTFHAPKYTIGILLNPIASRFSGDYDGMTQQADGSYAAKWGSQRGIVYRSDMKPGKERLFLCFFFKMFFRISVHLPTAAALQATTLMVQRTLWLCQVSGWTLVASTWLSQWPHKVHSSDHSLWVETPSDHAVESWMMLEVAPWNLYY